MSINAARPHNLLALHGSWKYLVLVIGNPKWHITIACCSAVQLQLVTLSQGGHEGHCRVRNGDTHTAPGKFGFRGCHWGTAVPATTKWSSSQLGESRAHGWALRQVCVCLWVQRGPEKSFATEPQSKWKDVRVEMNENMHLKVWCVSVCCIAADTGMCMCSPLCMHEWVARLHTGLPLGPCIVECAVKQDL